MVIVSVVFLLFYLHFYLAFQQKKFMLVVMESLSVIDKTAIVVHQFNFGVLDV